MERALPRLVSCAVTGVALFLIFGVYAPWRVGTEWSLASVGNLLYREIQRGEALDSRDEPIRRCLQGKTRITAEVLAGRMTLPEAAEAFREWNKTVKDGNEPWAAQDEEAVCRNVIAWARNAPSGDPERQAAVVSRLEGELWQLLHARATAGS